jgi:hypothetical protein
LALVIAGAMTARAQEPPPASVAPDAVQLSFVLAAKRPLLVEVVQSAELDIKATGGKASVNEALRYEGRSRFIDVLEVVDDERDEGTRTFIEATLLENGAIADPPLNGLVLRYVRAGEKVNLSIEGGRKLAQPKLNGHLGCFQSLGCWLQFPESGRVGDQIEVDLTPLAPVLVGDDTGKATGKASLKLESFDATTGSARFRGRATIQGQIGAKGVAVAINCGADCVLETCVPENRITSITLDGAVTVSAAPEAEGAKQGIRVEGKGKMSSRLTTHIGAAVEAARAEKPRFRDRLHKARAVGVSFALPSYYDEVEIAGLPYACQRMLGDAGVLVISANIVLADASDKEAFYKRTKQELDRDHKSVQTESVTSTLGAGRAYLFESGTGADKMRVRAEVYPLRDRAIIFRVHGCDERPDRLPVVTLDERLAAAAMREGFRVLGV